MDLNSWRSPKTWLVFLAIIAIAAVAIISILRDRIVNNQQWQVSVVGQGKASYQPDIATVTLGVQIDKAARAEDALDQLNGKMAKIIAAVKAAGIADEDIQTQNYSLYSQYDYIDNASTLTGYNANQQLMVKVREINKDADKVSKVIAAATKAGINQVLGVSFDISNLEDLKQEARIKAIADAKSKAGNIASTAGVRLDKVVGWWENIVQAPGISNSYYYDGKGGAGGAVASPSVPTGSQEIIIEINLSYKIK